MAFIVIFLYLTNLHFLAEDKYVSGGCLGKKDGYIEEGLSGVFIREIALRCTNLWRVF